MEKILKFHRFFNLIIILLCKFSYTKYSWYDLHLLNTTGALCLDGSPGSYYISRDGDPNNVLLYFQSGGWCGIASNDQFMQSCYLRSKTLIGTSTLFSASKRQTQLGIMTNDKRNNFKGWKKIILNYCDGAGFQGYKSQPIKYKDTYIYFRGHNITIQIFDNLQQKFSLFSSAKNLVVTGGSAGGLSVYFWVNHVADLVKNGKTWALPQSGIFPDSADFNTHDHTFRKSMQNLMNIANVQIDPPVPECIAQFPLQKVNCMFVTTLYKYVKVPQFVIQSLYDKFVVENILNVKCISEGGSLTNCNQSQRNYIEDYREQLTTFLYNVTKVNPRNGFWAEACSFHGIFPQIIYFSSRFTIPAESEFTASYAVRNWLEGNFQQNIYIDKGKWLMNQPCSENTFFVFLQLHQKLQVFIFALIFLFVILAVIIAICFWRIIIKICIGKNSGIQLQFNLKKNQINSQRQLISGKSSNAHNKNNIQQDKL